MGDAFGLALRDCYRDRIDDEPVHRRDDGVSWDATGMFESYFAPPEEWSDAEVEAVSHLTGTVLDLGCGAGRHALYLQDRHEVTAIDRSPLAIRIARERGVDRAIVGDMLRLPIHGEVGSVLAAGGQLGIPGSIAGLRELLDTLAGVTSQDGTLVADVLDPTDLEDPARRNYLEKHRLCDGAFVRRFRIEYEGVAGPWIDLLMLGPDALRDVVAKTEWRVREVLRRGGSYTAVLTIR